MKKRVLALILAIMMVVTNIAPSFASLGEDDSGQMRRLNLLWMGLMR